MNKLLLSVLAIFLASPLYALPEEASINFTLTEIAKGENCPAQLMQAPLVVDYKYDFKRNMGQAHLRELKGFQWSETLYPLGLSKYYAFMSDMAPKTVPLADGDVTIYRIIFHLHYDGQSQVWLMINPEGDCIMKSDFVDVN